MFKQPIKFNQATQITVNVDGLDLPALAVPTAWLAQLYASLDKQDNTLTLDTLKADVLNMLSWHFKAEHGEAAWDRDHCLNNINTTQERIPAFDPNGVLPPPWHLWPK